MEKCSITGHRPKYFGFNYDENTQGFRDLQCSIEKLLRYLIKHNITVFYVGMALGSDIWSAEILLKLKSEFKNIKVNAVIPCKTQSERWSYSQKLRYDYIISHCEEVIYISDNYTNDCMLKRNDYLVKSCDVLMSIWNGDLNTGTGYTVQKAREKLLPNFVIQLPSYAVKKFLYKI